MSNRKMRQPRGREVSLANEGTRGVKEEALCAVRVVGSITTREQSSATKAVPLWRSTAPLVEPKTKAEQSFVASAALRLQRKSGIRNPGSGVANPQPPTPNLQAEAEECFPKAIAIARRQQAKSLEPRAVMSLSRLWQQQGKRGEARRGC